MRMNEKLFFLIMAFGLAISPLRAEAQLPYAITDGEIAMLPKGCQVKLGKDPVANANWSERLGAETWMHMHHYCHGLKFINRARFTINKVDRKYYLQNAIGEFDYCLTHWPANSPMMREAQREKSEVEAMLIRH